MGRISRQVMFMQMARTAAMRSTCHRLNVGAIVVRDNNPVSIGWGGHEPGAPHCPGNTCPGIVPGNCPTIHAEVNALDKAQTLLLGLKKKPLDLYCTHSPCLSCTEWILKFAERNYSIGLSKIFFEVPYRNTQHLAMLHGKIEVYEVTPAGYIVDYFSRQVVELP